MKASLIIPTYDAVERLYYNLTALNYQNFPFNEFEAVVIDNGSKDNTSAMVKSFKTPYHVELIRLNKNMPLAVARNAGIRKAKGEILIFHDCDMLAVKDFVRKHVEVHNIKNTVVCGNSWRRIYTHYYSKFGGYLIDSLNKMLPKYNRSLQSLIGKDKYPILGIEHIAKGDFPEFGFDLAIPFAVNLKYTMGKYGANIMNYAFPWRMFITNNCSVEKQNVLNVGLMDEGIIRFGYEDYDLGLRLYKSGCRFVGMPEVLSLHQEHIPHSNDPDFWYNLYYVCKKYNSPHFFDFLLGLSYMYAPVSFVETEGIMAETKIIKAINAKTHDYLVGAFVKLLEIIRERHPKFNSLKCKNMKVPCKAAPLIVDTNPEKIRPLINELRNKHHLYLFANTISKLVKEVYNIAI